MRQKQKQSIIELTALLKKAQEYMKSLLSKQEYTAVLDLLQQCQQSAIQIGGIIEEAEGEGFVTVKYLEEYCELVFQLYEMVQNRSQNVPEELSDVSDNDKIFDAMNEILLITERSIENDIAIRKEVVFFPYKASMWDSLESIWMAADADPECDAYVVPIPYYERDSEGKLKNLHYEGKDFPEYVKITNYNDYPIEEIFPDAVFIHNPYDHENYVTSVHPRYYSYELKKYTDMLVYVPYYSTSGGMGEGQALCSAYLHVDYIVVQAEKYINFIDPSIPREKILPLGSPKFDRVLKLCQNPPKVPAEWEEKMRGKKVYFYNTSISGMLSDTRRFLLKMEYVFKCFAGREDACLLWRPHPLLESTFDSMRKAYRPYYDSLKNYFIQNNVGIYDDTPDMGKTIALCDAYVGDTASSVVSLFGLAGKEIFILNNYINALPEKDDWRGELIKEFFPDGYDRWRVTQGNKIYYSIKNDYHYEYYCDLNEYAEGGYYLKVIEMCGKLFVCPRNAQDILIVEDGTIIKKILLKKEVERGGAFRDAYLIGKYIYLVPALYPAIVRYDVLRDRVDYLDSYAEYYMKEVDGERRFGGVCVWKNFLLIASPTEDNILFIEAETMKVQIITTGEVQSTGGFFLMGDGDEIWITPFIGKKVFCWNPLKGTRREYCISVENFVCKNRPYGYICENNPFGRVASYGKYAVLAPFWGNMFVRIDKENGRCEEWTPQINMCEIEENGYYSSRYATLFVRQIVGPLFLLYASSQRKLYKVNIVSGECEEVQITFDMNDVKRNVAGFAEISQWFQYSGTENAFASLPQFLDGNLLGQPHNAERQKLAYRNVAENGDGSAGKKIYTYIKQRI